MVTQDLKTQKLILIEFSARSTATDRIILWT